MPAPGKRRKSQFKPKCKVCGQTFEHRSSLSRHLKSHSVQERIMCEICNASYTRKDFLLRHMRIKHVKCDKAPIWECAVCSGTFHEERTYQHHISTHQEILNVAVVIQSCGQYTRNDMEANIHDLPFEQLLHIYKHCHFTDLKNISLCCKSSYESVKEILWNKVTISWATLAHDSFKKRQLKNLKYTSVLRFCGNKDITGRKILWDTVRVNYRSILDHCNVDKLLTLEITGVIDDDGIEMFCSTLLRLQEVSINKCKYISQGWLWLDGLRDLKKLYVDKCPITKADVENVVEQSKFHELRLTRCINITNEVLKYLTKLTHLKVLELVFSRQGFANEYTFKNLQNFPNLTELALRGLRITNEVMPDISNIKALTLLTLDFDVNLVTEAGFSQLGKLSSLKKLSIARCNHIPDTGFSALTKLVSLVDLNLNHCRKLSATGFSYMSSLPSLTSLNVSNCPVNDSGFKHLCNIQKLKVLNIFYCIKVSDIGLGHIGKLKSLTTLYTGGRKLNLTNAGLLNIFDLPALKHLDLSCCNELKDEGMDGLVKLKHLETLNLNNCTCVTDDGLSYLKKLKHLKVLHISGLGKITDEGLMHIRKLSFLVELDISYSSLISDNGLFYVSKIGSLQKLLIIHCSNITDSGLSHLRYLRQLRYADVSSCRYVTDKGIHYLCKLPYLNELCVTDCSMVTMNGMGRYPHIRLICKTRD